MTTYDSIIIPGVDMPLKLDRLSHLDFEGMPPLRNVHEVSPRQAGSQIVDTFYDDRYGTLVMQVHKQDKHRVLNLFSPNRVHQFEESFIYNKEIDGGQTVRGNDGRTIANTGLFLSKTAKFVDVGGLKEGNWITIDGVKVKILQQYSDSVLIVDFTFLEDSTSKEWSYIAGRTTRKLYFQLQGGLSFLRTKILNGYTVEVIDIVAANPFWVGDTQAVVWFDLIVGTNKRYPVIYNVGELYDIFVSVEEVTINTASDVFIKPVLTIEGSMTYFRIDNFSQDTHLELIANLTQNQSIVIDLRNATAIQYPEEINVLHLVTGDLTTFGLMPNVDNVIKVDSDSITETSRTAVLWQNLYLGS